ncbi:hypothetical protein GOP47_0027413 [Adiantum capillus-veneris]|nr:hypothetical protein GOP47_0027413 [Adiantum capillus-veneris]
MQAASQRSTPTNGDFTRSAGWPLCLKRGESREAVALFCMLVTIISCLASACMAQEGFVSVDCGAPAGKYKDTKTGIEWVSDAEGAGFASSLQGETVSVAKAVQAPADAGAQSLSSVRYFPGEQSKYCYVFTEDTYDFIRSERAFLARASFWTGDDLMTFGNHTTFQLLINADIWDDVSIYLPQSDVVVKEAYILPSNDSSPPSISICLSGRGAASNMNTGIPFISSLELRLLPQEFYTWYTERFILPMHCVHTVNYGASTSDVIRYPNDIIDRLWKPDMSYQPTQNTTRDVLDWQILSYAPPPRQVLQTAYVQDEQIVITFQMAIGDDATYFMAGYIFDVSPTRLNGSNQRVFTWQTSGYGPNDPRDLFNFESGGEYYLVLYSGSTSPLHVESNGQLKFTFEKAPNSTYGPLINALQIFRAFGPVSPGSNSQEVDAIKFIQTNHFTTLRSWSGDPCLPYPYNWLNCTRDNIPRVSNILLSNHSLEGTIPLRISSLESLVGIFLDHNKLLGSIPNLGNLDKLETLRETLTVATTGIFGEEGPKGTFYYCRETRLCHDEGGASKLEGDLGLRRSTLCREQASSNLVCGLLQVLFPFERQSNHAWLEISCRRAIDTTAFMYVLFAVSRRAVLLMLLGVVSKLVDRVVVHVSSSQTTKVIVGFLPSWLVLDCS